MRRSLVALVLAACAHVAGAQEPPPRGVDAGLWAEILSLPAIDNHAHPMLALADLEGDPDFHWPMGDEPGGLPVGLRPENPVFTLARRALWGEAGSSAEAAAAARQSTRSRMGAAYPAWVLDKLGIEVMLANRTEMGAGLSPPRFLWVPFGSQFLFPLDNTAYKRQNGDLRARYTFSEGLLRRSMAEAGVQELPASLETYLARVVAPALERYRSAGAVALKMDTAYWRTLDFADPPQEQAARVYAQYIGGGEPPLADYRALQDFLFRYIAREAGRLGLVLHVHVGSGEGAYFSTREADPFLLEPVLNDPALRGTRFVLVHGGAPVAQQARVLLLKPNAWADISGMTFLLSARELSGVLRAWLEHMPEKVLFGTDAFPWEPDYGWEELAWTTSRTARRALAMALSGMMADGDISRERAAALARMVLRDNAARLYGLGPPAAGPD